MIEDKQGSEPAVHKRAYSTGRDRLKALEVKWIEEPGIYHDGGGLYLQVSPAGTKSWLFRYRLHDRMREMGLGSFKDFSLAEARERARVQRQLVADKIDPIEQRDARSQVAKAVAAQEISFEECARDYHKQEAVHWKNPKHRDQWINTLDTYAFPKLGKRKIHTIVQADFVTVLQPIWQRKAETASRVFQRLRSVLVWAAAKKLYPVHPRDMCDLVLTELGDRRGQRKKEHHLAAPYEEVSEILGKVRISDSQKIVKLAFEFTVLTAARSGETRGATWSEIDFDDQTWVIPATRMKAGKEHRVPLSTQCLELLHQAQELTSHLELIFCHPKTEKQFSDAIFTSMLHKGLKLPYTMHGFRSSFRDWGGEVSQHRRELLEISLAHDLGNKVEEAYRRGDMLDKRRPLMEDWARFAAKLKEM